ncbi:MAG: class I SAM-dependent methyltransferase [bacterium]
MLDSYPCPICTRDDCSQVETFVYLETDGLGSGALPLALVWRRLKTVGRILVLARPRRRPVTCRSLTAYQRLRRKVLFQVWFPARESVTLNTAYCTTCGFMAYSPRPTEEDVVAKYEYLKQYEPDVGGQAGYDSRALQSDLARAGRVYERCVAHFGSGKLKVLDYGGGNGKLLKPFVATGHACFIIDYNDNPVPGVTKIGDDMSTFATDDTFDLIICSHVLEHVSDLSGLVSFLRRRLDPNGLLYAEVPQEIWAGLRLEADPVTHINFFTRSSLAGLFLLNGFDLVESRQQSADYGKTPLEVIWVLARGGADPAGGDPDERRAGLALDVGPLLYPTRRASLRKMYQMSVAPKFRRLGRIPGSRPSAG